MKILLVDDHALIRDALREVVKSLKCDAEILETPDGRRTLLYLKTQADIDLVLLDLTLPDGNGLGLLTTIRNRWPSTGVAVLSAYYDRAIVEKVITLGAMGFIPKSSERSIITGALELIFRGGVYIPPEVFIERTAVQPPSVSIDASPPAIQSLGLTGRQLEVLALVLEGLSNKAIGRALNLAEPTVKNHVSAGLHALNVATRKEAIVAAGKLGLQLQDS